MPIDETFDASGNDFPLEDASGNDFPFDDASGNDSSMSTDPEYYNVTIYQLETEGLEGKLDDIKNSVNELSSSLGVSNSPLLLRGLDDNTSIDGYYVRSGLGENVYIPVDRIQYLSKTSNGNLINLSSSTIYCYSLDSYGNRGRYYRFQSFGTLEYQYQSGYNTYWESTSALADNSNLTLGQVGLHSFTELALALILFMVTLIFFFRRK